MKAIVTAVLFGSSVLAHAAAEKPNILFILADDQGYADTGFSGSRDLHTPNIDGIARKGTVLSSFYVQPCCSPTRATLMSGRYPTRTGVYNVVTPGAAWGLPLEERTLAEAMRDAGYETAICGKWHLGEFQEAYLPTHRGFDHQYGLWFGNIDYFTHMRGKILDWHRDDQPCKDEGYSTHLLAREACARIRNKAADKPLFLYLPFNAVHAPLQAPENYTHPYAELPAKRRTYAGMVAAMDEAIGQVLAALEETGLRTNTLIIFCSDNGGPAPGVVTCNEPLRAGKGTIYEGGMRVCACVSWPGHIPVGQTVKEPLHMVDWYPTLVKLAGGSLKQKLPLDGLDIWPVLTAKAASPHDAILLVSNDGTNSAAIRMSDWKLLVNPTDSPGKLMANQGVADRVELYNLADDVGEKRNLAATHPEKVKELRTRLDQLLANAVPLGSSKAKGGKMDRGE